MKSKCFVLTLVLKINTSKTLSISESIIIIIIKVHEGKIFLINVNKVFWLFRF